MKRNAILTIMILAAAAATSALSKETRPNILFIMTDDQWRPEFNFLPEGRDEDGKPKNLTPTIDRLSSEGIILDRMYATSTVCTPSRFSVLTGEYPSRSQDKGFLQDMEAFGNQPNPHFNVHVTPGKANIGSVLKENGYFTGFAGKNHVLHSDTIKVPGISPWRDADPFDAKTQEFLESKQAAEVASVLQNGFDYAASIYAGNVPGHMPIKMEAHNQDWITKGGLDFLEQAEKQDKPFYLHFCSTLNHGPGPAGHKYSANPRFTPAGVLGEPLQVQPARNTIPKRLKAAGYPPKGDHADALWLDDGINAIITKLEEMGELDNTIIFFFVDNGMGAKGALYEGGAHVPAFVWGKNLKGKRRADQLLANIDFAPTIYELCGIPESKQPPMDGTSFTSVLQGDSKEVRKDVHLQIGSSRAVLKDGFKYIAWRVHPDREEKFDIPKNGEPKPLYHIASTRGGRGLEKKIPKNYAAYWDIDQLYDLSKDPKEQKNLANHPEYAQKLQQLKRTLMEQLEGQPGTFAEFKPTTKLSGK
ncbi:Arylsulfatase [Pontiella desulfatans]|uniref:Arylsulfatase n=1 Tax=Pontiella desulfatans TaxID=2750659 RepID=A0A6C2U9R5_PONDE|nr:sulfatase-like hydrolase/transferase [Pontiella desulfatans]SPS74014.1 sulfatase S1_51 [Kiritimatiellales bacterium]VGO16261.1 Arylsulfatase [Pontiella desulfatans]